MPGLVRKLLVIAAADGLVLQPLAQRNQRAVSPIQVDYKTHTVGPLPGEPDEDAWETDEKFEADGIVGFLNVFTYSYLIAVVQKRQVAQLWGKPVFAITNVAIIPLQSHAEAKSAVQKAAEAAQHYKHGEGGDHAAHVDLVEDADNDALTSLEDTWLDDEVSKDSVRPPSKGSSAEGAKEPGIAEGVISRKGLYGRFAERWFSKRGWTTGQRRNLGLSGQEAAGPDHDIPTRRRKSSSLHTSPTISPERPGGAVESLSSILEHNQPSSDADSRRVTLALLPKLLQTTKLLLMSRTFYFSYEFDISRRLSSQAKASTDVPLYKQFDSQYFWNSHITSSLVHGGYDEFILPVMQGFIGQRAFSLQPASSPDPSQPAAEVAKESDGTQQSVKETQQAAQEDEDTDYLLTLISRRTTKRAGFRYLRRGIDEDGNVANCVETEQILSRPAWEGAPVHSFVQTRGSIPLFFMQTPYTFKPVPTLHESREANKKALKKHFAGLQATYGAVQAVSLIDQHGTEVQIGNAYEDYVRAANRDGGQPVAFDWFDFHSVCRGMKFENVSLLIGRLAPFLASTGWTTLDGAAPSPSPSARRQSGIVRTNCMDCLDRTNVVQSAIALHTLQQQLSPTATAPSTPSPSPSAAFNALWADNGDAVSVSYAGTAALKGDFVRTRRRTALGLLSDLGLTLSRYYRNLFDDFFAQAALDYLLGHASARVFAEFTERMTTADPAVDLGRARQAAVSTAAALVVADEHEDLLAGWAVGAPAAASLATALAPAPPTPSASVPAVQAGPAALRAQPFREVLLLLSDRALYAVAYDWDAEKVRGFERVALGRVGRLGWGTFVTETNAPGQTDASRNAGLRVEFGAAKGRPRLRRMNTRTVGELAPHDVAAAGGGEEGDRDGVEAVVGAAVAGAAAGAVGAAGGAAAATEAASNTADDEHDNDDGEETDVDEETRVLAFKILPRQSSVIRPSMVPSAEARSERELAEQVCGEIAAAVRRCTAAGSTSATPSNSVVVEEKDVVSLEDARKSTTLVESLGYGLKKLVWG